MIKQVSINAWDGPLFVGEGEAWAICEEKTKRSVLLEKKLKENVIKRNSPSSSQVLGGFKVDPIYSNQNLKNGQNFKILKFEILDTEKCGGCHGDSCDNMIYMMSWFMLDP